MKLKLVVILLAAMVSMPAVSKQFTTVGAYDCGQWIKNPQNHAKAWMLGYISGLNGADTTRGDVLAKISSGDQLLLWMDNYCRANPLKSVADGANELYVEIGDKKN